MSKIIGVIGATPGPESFEFLKRCLYDNSLSPDFAAQLLIGIAASQPSSYHEFIPRFFDRVKQASISFDLHHIAEGLAHYVHDDVLVEKLGLVPLPYFSQLLELLTVPPVDVEQARATRTPHFLVSRKGDFTLISGTNDVYQLDVGWDLERREAISDVWEAQQMALGEAVFA